jgi:hypothetical protein
MKLFNFIVWLSTGAVIGWFAQWMIKTEHRQTSKLVHDKDHSSTKR